MRHWAMECHVIFSGHYEDFLWCNFIEWRLSCNWERHFYDVNDVGDSASSSSSPSSLQPLMMLKMVNSSHRETLCFVLWCSLSFTLNKWGSAARTLMAAVQLLWAIPFNGLKNLRMSFLFNNIYAWLFIIFHHLQPLQCGGGRSRRFMHTDYFMQSK